MIQKISCLNHDTHYVMKTIKSLNEDYVQTDLDISNFRFYHHDI